MLRRRVVVRRLVFTTVVLTILALLFALPWWALVYSSTDWPTPVVAVGTLVFVAMLIALPTFMFLGHGPRHLDWAARLGDALLGVVWVLFVWTLIGDLLRLALLIGGVDNPARSRIVAIFTLVAVVVLLAWGFVEAMRIPRVVRLDVTIPRLGRDLDGTTVVAITDTHYGAIDRAKWSAGVVEAVNELNADIVCHVGDIADGTVTQRRLQAEPLASVRARLAKVYVTGNHEYFSEAQGWLDYMTEIGWESLHNRHVVVGKGGSELVIAGVDDATARGSGLEGHGANLAEALRGADPDSPILLLAHQPKQVKQAEAAGVDLQLAGHTHGGQMWPFNFLVRLDQPVVHGLAKFGERTQLYTSRGSGFWGPPFRIFAPSEITLITLRAS
nr:metallophosphoesterase [Antrihabitans sp. YC2-6]